MQPYFTTRQGNSCIFFNTNRPRDSFIYIVHSDSHNFDFVKTNLVQCKKKQKLTGAKCISIRRSSTTVAKNVFITIGAVRQSQKMFL